MTRNRIAHPLSLALSAVLALGAAPAIAQTSIDKVNGSITADAGQTFGDLDTVNGSIRIEAGARVADAGTVNGSIKVAENATVESLSTVNGSIRAEAGLKADGDVSTVNGSIFVGRGGSIGGDVETVNGALGLVDTDLAGGIETVNGDLTVGAGSHVRGGIRYTKPTRNWVSFGKKRDPRVIIGPNARVDGPLVFERDVKLYVHSTAQIGSVTGATAQRYDSDRAPRD